MVSFCVYGHGHPGFIIQCSHIAADSVRAANGLFCNPNRNEATSVSRFEAGRQRNRGSFLGGGKTSFSFPKPPDRLWGAPHLLHGHYRGRGGSPHPESRLRVSGINRLTPNDPYMGRTAPLTSKRCILYIYSTNVGTEYFKHALYTTFFSVQNTVCFIMLTCLGTCIIDILYTGCAKIKKRKFRRQRVNPSLPRAQRNCDCSVSASEVTVATR
jgi:hypothetical protein